MNYEHVLEKGVHDADSGETRTDICLVESKNSFDLELLTGNGKMVIVDIWPEDLIRIAEFFHKIASDKIAKPRTIKP